MSRPKRAVPDHNLYRDDARRHPSQALELKDTKWGKILLFRDETGHIIPCYLEKGEKEKALTLASSVVSETNHEIIEMMVSRAYELRLDDPENQVENAESLLRRTWISVLFTSWLEAIDARAWMMQEDLEAAIMEVSVVTPIMDS